MNIRINGKICAAICFVGAGAVAMSGHDGWGWLLFVGILLF